MSPETTVRRDLHNHQPNTPSLNERCKTVIRTGRTALALIRSPRTLRRGSRRRGRVARDRRNLTIAELERDAARRAGLHPTPHQSLAGHHPGKAARERRIRIERLKQAREDIQPVARIRQSPLYKRRRQPHARKPLLAACNLCAAAPDAARRTHRRVHAGRRRDDEPAHGAAARQDRRPAAAPRPAACRDAASAAAVPPAARATAPCRARHSGPSAPVVPPA